MATCAPASEVPLARNWKRGVTLIEILIVLAVVVVLSALLMSVASSSRSSAENAKSVANLRQIASILYQYAGDHNGNIPPRIEQVILPNGSSVSGLSWHSRLLLDGYVTDKNIFFNPKEKYKTWQAWANDATLSASLRNPMSAWHPVYGYRNDRWPNTEENTRHHLPSLSHPSQFFIMVESWMVDSGYPGYFVSSGHPSWRIKIDKRGIANTLFADGHVDAKTRDYFISLPLTPAEVTGGGNYKLWPENP